MWEYHAQHPELGERAAKAMVAFTKGAIAHDTISLTRGYDWSDLAAKGGTLVHLGGGNGHIAATIAQAHPSVRCIVQEIPGVVANARYEVPSTLADRITFAAHDFFRPQPTTAGAYLFRQIFHNWSDKHCIAMLRALVPAHTPRAMIIVNDRVLPPPGVLPSSVERGIRAMDMIMMSLFSARERRKENFEQLFTEADARFQQVKVWKPEGSQLRLVEANWVP